MASDLTLYDSTGNPVVLDGDTAKQALNGIGWDQTWQDMISQRELDTEYTNDTGKPIQISISAQFNQTSSGGSNIIVDGINISYLRFETAVTVANYIPISFIVPNGSVYSIITGGIIAIVRWAELR